MAPVGLVSRQAYVRDKFIKFLTAISLSLSFFLNNRTHVGKPIEYDGNNSVEEIVQFVGFLICEYSKNSQVDHQLFY